MTKPTVTADTRPTVTIMPTKLAEALTALIPLADAACDYADQNCRAFPIATAPDNRDVFFWDSLLKEWQEFTMLDLSLLPSSYTHWREPLPPPTNPPLPAVFTELGAALEKINAPHA